MNLAEGLEGVIQELQDLLDFTNKCIQEGIEAGLEASIHVSKWEGMAYSLEVSIEKLDVLLETGSNA